MTWQLASFSLLFLALGAGFAWYERAKPSAKVIALVATLAALAAIGRAAFAPLPNIKPTTDIVLLAGFALGAGPGFVVGAVGALASNLFFGQGPHTPWQMAAWGAVGVFGALLARAFGRDLGRFQLAGACGLAGLAFGAWMDLHLWVLWTDHRLAEYGVLAGRSLPFNAAHVVGNVVFCLAFGPALVRALMRFRRRFDVVWHPAPAPVAATTALVAVVLALGAVASPEPAQAAGPSVERAASYVRSAQTADGGFAGGKGGRSASPIYSGWAIMGLAAAGKAPGPEAVAYLERQAERVTDLGDIERTILALRAAGANADPLVEKLVAAQREDGSIQRLVNRTAFLVLSLRSAGRPKSDPAIRRATTWLLREQNRNGGFGTGGRGTPASIDDTSAAMQALVAAGRKPRSAPVRRATSWLLKRQGRDGGFPLSPGTPSNAQSTAWAVQGLVAAGRKLSKVRRRGSRNPLAYLRSLQASDGSVSFNRTSEQTPTWVTAQALAALALKPLPVRPPPAARAQARAAQSEADKPPAALISLVLSALIT